MSFINLIQSCINDANTYNSNRYINNLCLTTFAIKRHFHNFLLCIIVIQNKIIQNTSCIHFLKKNDVSKQDLHRTFVRPLIFRFILFRSIERAHRGKSCLWKGVNLRPSKKRDNTHGAGRTMNPKPTM